MFKKLFDKFELVLEIRHNNYVGIKKLLTILLLCRGRRFWRNLPLQRQRRRAGQRQQRPLRRQDRATREWVML